MGARIRCKKCGTQFTRSTGSNRLNCETCKPPRVAPPKPAPVVVPEPRGPGPLELAVVAELERTHRLSTVKGQIAVRLARALDDPELPEGRLSALGAQLERTMDSATAGAPPPPDHLDELGERRRQMAAEA